MKSKIIYVDMDGVLTDWDEVIERQPKHLLTKYEGKFDEIPGLFSQMKPIRRAIRSFELLAQHYDVYILSTPGWNVTESWTHKAEWVKYWLPEAAYKRLILTHHKNLLAGDYLIDDRLAHGVDKFKGEHIHFGTPQYPDWISVMEYFLGEKA